MSAREELQQWVDDAPRTVGVQVDDKTYYSMDVDLARRLLAELDAAHTWDGIMALVDEHYPTDIFPHLAGQPDNPERDPDPRILSLIREVDRLRAASIWDSEGICVADPCILPPDHEGECQR